jgi:Flp pilus assembly pilin Flp
MKVSGACSGGARGADWCNVPGWVDRMGESSTLIANLWEDEQGGAALEYALLAGGIFLAIVGAITFYIDKLETMFNNIANNV